MQATLIVWCLRLWGLFSDEDYSRQAQLIEATSQLPDVEPAFVEPTVRAALAEETARFPAELLIAIAWGESRFDATVITGKCCGTMQTMAHSRADCIRWRDPRASFAAGVAELDEWAHDKHTHGALRLILLAQACGYSAFNGTCKKTRWPSWVLARARRLGMRVSPSS
jgi:hypothetical protein